MVGIIAGIGFFCTIELSNGRKTDAVLGTVSLLSLPSEQRFHFLPVARSFGISLAKPHGAEFADRFLVTESAQGL